MREVEASAEVVRLTVHICGDVNGSLAEGEDDGEDEAMAGHMPSPRPTQARHMRATTHLLGPPHNYSKPPPTTGELRRVQAAEKLDDHARGGDGHDAAVRLGCFVTCGKALGIQSRELRKSETRPPRRVPR